MAESDILCSPYNALPVFLGYPLVVTICISARLIHARVVDCGLHTIFLDSVEIRLFEARSTPAIREGRKLAGPTLGFFDKYESLP